MKHRTMRGITALALGATLALAGCSSGDGSGSKSPSASPSASASTGSAMSAKDVAALKDVKVTGKQGEEPKVTFTTPFKVDGRVAQVNQAGTGAALKEGQKLSMKLIAYDGNTGKKLNSWSDPEQSFMYDSGQTIPELIEILKGQKVGVRFLVAIPGEGEEATQLLVSEITSAKDVPSRAEGEAVTPAAGLPTVTLDDKGKPSIKIPDGYKPPAELVVQPLIKGSGPKVEAGQTVTINYTGWLLDGTSFDSSWEKGAPISQPLANFIQGWQQGLVGQTVGSQVELIIPPDLAYGDKENGSIPANSTLIFVVDILEAE